METRSIPARSKRQVMDWSLVLASQGMEPEIFRTESEWQLIVRTEDYPRAVAAIRQYQIENRRWRWQHRLPRSALWFHGGSAIWCAFLGLVFIYQIRAPGFQYAGVMDNAAVSAGQWWRLFTAVTLHGDVAHLVANVTTGFVLLGLAMAQYGPATALLATYVAGAGGNLAGFVLYAGPHRSLGASGMVMGALGLLSVQAVREWRRNRSSKRLVARCVFGGILILVLLGFSPGTDIVAHLGGFAFGAASGFVLSWVPEKVLESPAVNKACAVFLSALVFLCWWLAIRTG